MLNWFEHVNEKTRPIFDAIVDQPFIKQLITGDLAPETFTFYIQQDALYLDVYKRLLALIGTQCDDSHDCQFFLASATGVLAVETALHEHYLGGKVEATASPSCELYTSYLAKMVYTQPLAVAMAAVLPCFTIYKAVGDYILEQPKVNNNPYQDWINTYGGEDFATSTKQAIQITNKFAEQADSATLNKMEAAFVKASKL